MFDLSDHVALVTGGNGGLGLGMAKGLAKAGASVAIWGRNDDKNAKAIEVLREQGATAEAFKCDVTDTENVKDVFAKTVERFGKVDSCFANAGGSGPTSMFHQLSDDKWASIVDLNLNSVVNTFKPAIEHMIERRQGGKLVVTSSVAANLGTPLHAGYSTTKAAVVGLVQALAIELGRAGIQANAILPGYIETDMSLDTSQEFRDACLRRTASGKLGTADDMQGVAVFLASQQSNLMTGQTIVLDGGQTIHPL